MSFNEQAQNGVRREPCSWAPGGARRTLCAFKTQATLSLVLAFVHRVHDYAAQTSHWIWVSGAIDVSLKDLARGLRVFWYLDTRGASPETRLKPAYGRIAE